MRMKLAQRTRLVLVMAILLAGGRASASRAQEAAAPEGVDAALETALALEEVYIRAISKAEKSVVAIGRVRRDDDAAGAELKPGEQPASPPVRLPLDPDQFVDPADPDFLPDQFGAGVVIDAEGYIVTNLHVLGDVLENDYYIYSDGVPHRAKAAVKATDPWLDLAVLKIDGVSLTPMTMGSGAAARKGQFVIALGNPYAIARDGRPSASRGIIANLSRRAAPIEGEEAARDGEPPARTLHHYGTLLQTDCNLAIGSSGGALVDLKGEMIGLTSSLAPLAGYDKSGGFAIPVDETFHRAVAALKAGHQAEYGFLGIAPGNLSMEERQAGAFGAVVADVVAATPAAKAGLRVRDVVTHIDGERVEDANTLIRDISRLPADATVTLTVLRPSDSGRLQAIEAVASLSKKYVAAKRPAYSEAPPLSWRGVQVEQPTATARFQELSHLADPEGCVIVTSVERDSPAWKAGLRPWSFISRVQNARISTPASFFIEANKYAGEVSLIVTAADGKAVARSVSP